MKTTHGVFHLKAETRGELTFINSPLDFWFSDGVDGITMEKLDPSSLEFLLRGLGKPELVESFAEFVSRRESLVRELREALSSEQARKMLESVFADKYKKGQQLVVDDNGGIFFMKVRGMSIDDLRARAKELGVDVSDLGRKKAEMFSRIEEAEKNRFQEVVPGTLPKV